MTRTLYIGSCSALIAALFAFLIWTNFADAVGLRGYENAPWSEVPSAIKNGQGMALLEKGFIDVTKAPYNANPNGSSDASGAFDRAMADGFKYNFTVYVPKGTYLIGKPLVFEKYGYQTRYASDRKFSNVLIGDTSGGTHPVLRIKDGAIPAGKSAIMFIFEQGCTTVQSACQYMSQIRGFEIQMGNNPGAYALSMPSAQGSIIEDIIIRGTNFAAGLKDLPGSGGSTTNVEVYGGDIGIYQDEYRPTPSVHDVKLVDQKVAGIQIKSVRSGVIVAGFEIKGSGSGYTGVIVPSGGEDNGIVLTDGSIELSGGAQTAVSSNGAVVHMDNVYVKAPTIFKGGSQTAAGSASSWMRVSDLAFAGKGQSMWVNGNKGSFQKGSISQVSSAPSGELRELHGWEAEDQPTYFNTASVDIRTYGATPDNESDNDAAAINQALKDTVTKGHQHYGKAVFIPRGFFHVSSPVEVPIGAKLIGSSHTNSIIQSAASWKPSSKTALVRTENGKGKVFLADFVIDGREPWKEYDALYRAGPYPEQENIVLLHVRSSDTLLRAVQVNRWEHYPTPATFKEPVFLIDGNGGGRFYYMPLDLWHINGSDTWRSEHRMILVDGTTNPVRMYNPNSEGNDVHPQVEIRNARNVWWYGLKYEKYSDNSNLKKKRGTNGVLRIANSENVIVYGGSGNYSLENGDKPLMEVNGSDDVALSMVHRKHGPSTAGPSLLTKDGAQIFPATPKQFALFQLGSPQSFGEYVSGGGSAGSGSFGGGGSSSGGNEPDPGCNLYGSGDPAPTGFGQAWNTLASSRELLLRSNCSGSSAQIVAGSGSVAQYIYKQGYLWSGSVWNPMNFSGSNLIGGDWYVGEAFASLNAPSGTTFWVGYVCQWTGSQWKCGCRDTSCTANYWQLQGIVR